MKAISVWNPWAWALVAGHKTVENRDWKLPRAFIGERVLVHCGKRKPILGDVDMVADWARMNGHTMPEWARRAVGGLVGSLVFEADLTVVEVSRGPEWAFGERCWAVRPGSPVMFRAAIPCKGALGFFGVGEDIERRVQP
jgi:hypothetical protein